VDDHAVDADLRNDRSFLDELVAADRDPIELRLHPTHISDRQVHTPTGSRSWWVETLPARSSTVDGVTDYEWSDGALVCRLD
jgi:poly-gamma-glutamate synthesis protein (capsule biosynthesis protein)